MFKKLRYLGKRTGYHRYNFDGIDSDQDPEDDSLNATALTESVDLDSDDEEFRGNGDDQDMFVALDDRAPNIPDQDAEDSDSDYIRPPSVRHSTSAPRHRTRSAVPTTRPRTTTTRTTTTTSSSSSPTPQTITRRQRVRRTQTDSN